MTAPGAAPDREPALRREIGLVQVTLAGTGVILGAGIYVLIGEAASEAGSYVWLSFVLAAVVTGFTGLSYAELAAMYPRAGAGYEYVRQAFGVHVAFVMGWLTVTAVIIAAAAVALGFGANLEKLADVDDGLAALLLLAAGAGVAASGALSSVRVAALLTLVEAAGLVLVSAIGFADFDLDHFGGDGSLLPILSGAALVFFAYIGFEEIATFSEEVRRPQRTVPLAIIISVIVATALYIAVAVASVGAIGAEALGEAPAPLATVAELSLSEAAGDVLAAFALAATANTALLMLMASCRVVYGMASTGAIPRRFARVSGATRIPITGLIAVSLPAAAVTLWGDVGEVADVTNFALFVAFALVNASVIVLRNRVPDAPRPFRTPGALRLPRLGEVPVLPALGVLSLAALLFRVDRISMVGGMILLVAGLVLAVAFRGQRDEAAAEAPPPA